MEAEQITPHVHSLHVQLDWFPQPYPPNVFLVVDGNEGALIDAGFPDDESISKRLEMLRSFPGLKVRYIVITHHHFDHASGAPKLRDARPRAATLGAARLQPARAAAAPSGKAHRARGWLPAHGG